MVYNLSYIRNNNRDCPILISDDEDDFTIYGPTDNQCSIVLDDDDEEYDSDATLPGSTTVKYSAHGLPINVTRNLPAEPPYAYIEQYYIKERDISLKIRDTVELLNDKAPIAEDRRGDFLRIRYIIENCATGDVILRGWRFRRNFFIHGMLPKKLNEVCLVLDIDDDDSRPPMTQGMDDVPINRVYAKRKLVLTNRNWPAVSFREQTAFSSRGPDADMHKKTIHNHEILVCRWISVSRFANSIARGQQRIASFELRRITEHESDANEGSRTTTIPDSSLTREWLGRLPEPTKVHTLGDAFAGAGGFSEGAAQAGASIKWSFDADPQASATYRLNHLDTDAYLCTADQFIEIVRNSTEHYVAILHVSPPCQPYSAAHTQPGRLDEQNTATLFAVMELIKRIKPRVVTLEQTSGIISHHPVWFRALVNMITTVGYSVRWKVHHLDGYGVPQKRKRLIMFASCPGGVLPEFPAPAYGPATSRPYVTIADALAPLSSSHNITHHNVQRAVSRNLPPYSAHTQLRGCITTGGGTNYHPHGIRDFTIRELALLQSLPVTFKFGEGQGVTALRRQIGNMVPAVAAKALVEAVIKALDREDNERSHEMIVT